MTADKLSATKLARKYNTSVSEVQHQLVQLGYIEVKSGLHYFTDLGKSVGGEYRKNHQGASNADGHMVWPANIPLTELADMRGEKYYAHCKLIHVELLAIAERTRIMARNNCANPSNPEWEYVMNRQDELLRQLGELDYQHLE